MLPSWSPESDLCCPFWWTFCLSQISSLNTLNSIFKMTSLHIILINFILIKSVPNRHKQKMPKNLP